jgi:hypothetical protein
VQQHLRQAIADDPDVVALGLGEAWPCGSPENVRNALGWAARSSERNGVAMVARYGFAGPGEWVQLDTSLNSNPADTMWVLRLPVCLDSGCTRSIVVFTAHWYASGDSKSTSYDRQAAQTVAFLQRAGGAAPHVLIGDLNVWEGVRTCSQNPSSYGLNRLREAGYLDAWPLVHGRAEGFTGMVNRAGCGIPTGYAWKRIDYAWSPAGFPAVGITRFGLSLPGTESPSDHYGIIVPTRTIPASSRIPRSTAACWTTTGASAPDSAAAAADGLAALDALNPPTRNANIQNATCLR